MRRWRPALRALILCGICLGLSGNVLRERDLNRSSVAGTESVAYPLTADGTEYTQASLTGVADTADHAAADNTDAEGTHTEEASAEMSAGTESLRIALTFDDGPHPVCTPQMLEVLARGNVPATFFLLGENVELYGDIVKDIAAQGHLIGNHTWHHVQITTLSLEEARAEILETSDLIEELTGQGTEYVRPPFGTWNPDLESDLDLIPVMWSIDTLDWTTENVDRIVEQVVREASENDIILTHGSYESTVQAVERIIPLLQARGFEFVTVDQVIMD